MLSDPLARVSARLLPFPFGGVNRALGVTFSFLLPSPAVTGLMLLSISQSSIDFPSPSLVEEILYFVVVDLLLLFLEGGVLAGLLGCQETKKTELPL